LFEGWDEKSPKHYSTFYLHNNHHNWFVKCYFCFLFLFWKALLIQRVIFVYFNMLCFSVCVLVIGCLFTSTSSEQIDVHH
jgi:hypothetical protein